MRYLTIAEFLETYQRVIQQTGGLVGIRDLGGLESAVAQPYMTFDGKELYPSLVDIIPTVTNCASRLQKKRNL